jgi:hypothetical protein
MHGHFRTELEFSGQAVGNLFPLIIKKRNVDLVLPAFREKKTREGYEFDPERVSGGIETLKNPAQFEVLVHYVLLDFVTAKKCGNPGQIKFHFSPLQAVAFSRAAP